jgi:hypothetical protein
MNRFNREAYIDASCQVWFNLAKKFTGPNGTILTESIYVRSPIKLPHFVAFFQQIWPPRAIVVSYWLLLKQSTPLKLLGQMEANLAGSIYVRSSIKFLRFINAFCQDCSIWPSCFRGED